MAAVTGSVPTEPQYTVSSLVIFYHRMLENCDHRRHLNRRTPSLQMTVHPLMLNKNKASYLWKRICGDGY